ncbi:MAG: tetratricopeptide repeat protein [Cyanobacteria bacterium]|nr:tetratricopeptide repeat protein [Cyanobacteriota bacterium]
MNVMKQAFKKILKHPSLRVALSLTALILCLNSETWAADFPGRGVKAEWRMASKTYDSALGYYHSDAFEKAVAPLEQAIQTYPYDQRFYVALGMAYKGLKNYEKAESTLITGSQAVPESWEIWNALAHVYYQEKKYEKSLEAANQALSLAPPQHDRLILEQAVYYTKQRIEEATAKK